MIFKKKLKFPIYVEYDYSKDVIIETTDRCGFKDVIWYPLSSEDDKYKLLIYCTAYFSKDKIHINIKFFQL